MRLGERVGIEFGRYDRPSIGAGLCIHMAGILGVITRLRNPLLAPLRDSPKPGPDLHLVIQGFAGKKLDPGSLHMGPESWELGRQTGRWEGNKEMKMIIIILSGTWDLGPGSPELGGQ